MGPFFGTESDIGAGLALVGSLQMSCTQTAQIVRLLRTQETGLLQNHSNWGQVTKIAIYDFQSPPFLLIFTKKCTKPRTILIETVLSVDPCSTSYRYFE